MANEETTVGIALRIPESDLARLDEMACRTFRSRSDLIRLAIDKVLNEGAEVSTAAEEIGRAHV